MDNRLFYEFERVFNMIGVDRNMDLNRFRQCLDVFNYQINKNNIMPNENVYRRNPKAITRSNKTERSSGCKHDEDSYGLQSNNNDYNLKSNSNDYSLQSNRNRHEFESNVNRNKYHHLKSSETGSQNKIGTRRVADFNGSQIELPVPRSDLSSDLSETFNESANTVDSPILVTPIKLPLKRLYR